jgi:hypothetical protein
MFPPVDEELLLVEFAEGLFETEFVLVELALRLFECEPVEL